MFGVCHAITTKVSWLVLNFQDYSENILINLNLAHESGLISGTSSATKSGRVQKTKKR